MAGFSRTAIYAALVGNALIAATRFVAAKVSDHRRRGLDRA